MVTVTPRMYRQAIAISIGNQRPACDVKLASPESTIGELLDFQPHLLVHSDNDGLGSEAVADVLCRVTVLYTDGMNARITARGQVREAPDMTMEDLLQVVDSASTLAGE